MKNNYKLKDLVNIKAGQLINKKYIDNNIGVYPVINSGIEPLGYINKYNTENNSIGITTRGANVGTILWTEGKYFRGNLNYGLTIKDKSILNERFLYHLLLNSEKQIKSKCNFSGIPALNLSNLENIILTIPSLEEQENIVKVLDTLTTYKDTLKDTLKDTRKQYEYYLNELMTFGEDEIDYFELKDIFDLRNGYTPSKKEPSFWKNGEIPWFRMEDLRKSGSILSDSIQKVHRSGVKGKLFKKDTIIMATTATIGEHAIVTVDYLSNQRFTNFSLKEKFVNRLDMKFVYYYFFIVDEFAKKNTQTSGFPSVNMKSLKKLNFPIPSLEKQKEIVSVLDNFYKLTNDLSSGLPLQIELVEKQYQYYRNQLLSF